MPLGKESYFKDVTVLAGENSPRQPPFSLLPISQWELNDFVKSRLGDILERYYHPEDEEDDDNQTPPSLPPPANNSPPAIKPPPEENPAPDPAETPSPADSVPSGGCSLSMT